MNKNLTHFVILNFRTLINSSQDKDTEADVKDKGVIFDEVIYGIDIKTNISYKL